MRTDRAYRKALTYEQAMTELLAGAGTQFDPKVVRSLVRVIDAEERSAPDGRPDLDALEPPEALAA
jgi:HD-GYP domain-containing protein (c-di-GMP phosphodiesterase class II)